MCLVFYFFKDLKKEKRNFQLHWQVTLLASSNLTPVTRAVMRVML